MIAKSFRPNSCAFFAMLQNEIPWAPASFNFSDIFLATSSSSIGLNDNFQWVLEFVLNFAKISIDLLLSYVTLWKAQCSKMRDSGSLRCFAI